MCAVGAIISEGKAKMAIIRNGNRVENIALEGDTMTSVERAWYWRLSDTALRLLWPFNTDRQH
jgi:hypothetical protein